MIDNTELEERVILVAVRKSERDNTEESLDELSELASTAGAAAVGRIIQNLDKFNPATYVGKGKLEEIRELIIIHDATGIICDDELTPAQFSNLSEALDVKIMDRTMLILDIFAKRASTGEGKIQVELAQLKYRASRLTGLGKSMSRLGGGIGTRGPGETRLETDRRNIHERIGHLKKELEAVETHRELTRLQRSRSNIPVAAIVGYTNAGKSTLLNTLTGADVVAENKLFATLDPTVRSLELESGQQVLLTDTVGFISKLPHNLIEAFKSTLEEALYADIIIHVVDSSNPAMYSQMHVVYQTLEELGVTDKPVITAFNKIELADSPVLKDLRADHTLRISAKHGNGIDRLKSTLEDVLRESKIMIDRLYAYDEASKISVIRKYGQLISEEYEAGGIKVKAYVPAEIYGKVK